MKTKLNDTAFINKVNTVVENSITKVFSKADQYALLSGKIEKVLESLKTSLSEEAFEYLKNNLQKEQISDLMEAVRKLEKELGTTEIKLSKAQVKKLLESLKDGKGVDSVVAELKTWCENSSKSPSEIAKSWQGSGRYPGIDDYTDVIIEKGTTLYRGEPNGTEYFTTLKAIDDSGRDATTIFEGLQVEKNPIHGYRGEMKGYMFNEDVLGAYGIVKANPQFGKGGLPQYYIPNVQELIDTEVLVPIKSIKLYK